MNGPGDHVGEPVDLKRALMRDYRLVGSGGEPSRHDFLVSRGRIARQPVYAVVNPNVVTGFDVIGEESPIEATVAGLPGCEVAGLRRGKLKEAVVVRRRGHVEHKSWFLRLLFYTFGA